MNIVFANFASKDNWGGGENWTLRSARGLTDQGHKVLVVGRKGSDMLPRCQELKVNATEVSVSNDYSLFSILELQRIFKSFKAEVVVVHHNRDVRTAGVAAKLSGLAVVHRNGFPVIHNNKRHKFTQKFVDRILTNSARIKSTYLKYGWFNENKFDVVPNGFFPNFKNEDVDIRKEFSISEEKLIVIYAGRLTGVKRVEDLITAISKLPQGSRWHLLIFGKGSREDQLKELVSVHGLTSKISFAGFRSNVIPYLKHADLVALPSADEGMPNTLMESMAQGTAVAATPVGDVNYLLDEGKAGYIIEVGDINGWADFLVNVESDNSLLLKLSSAGQERIHKHFTFDNMIDGIESSLKRALEDRKH